jgi:hypothetical protein
MVQCDSIREPLMSSKLFPPCCSDGRRRDVVRAVTPHRRDDPRKLIRQRHRRLVVPAQLFHLQGPVTARRKCRRANPYPYPIPYRWRAEVTCPGPDDLQPLAHDGQGSSGGQDRGAPGKPKAERIVAEGLAPRRRQEEVTAVQSVLRNAALAVALTLFGERSNDWLYRYKLQWTT